MGFIFIRPARFATGTVKMMTIKLHCFRLHVPLVGLIKNVCAEFFWHAEIKERGAGEEEREVLAGSSVRK